MKRTKMSRYRYRVKEVRELRDADGKMVDGLCWGILDGIEVREELVGADKLDAHIHEQLEMSNRIHDYRFPHHIIQTLATDLAEALWGLGFRVPKI